MRQFEGSEGAVLDLSRLEAVTEPPAPRGLGSDQLRALGFVVEGVVVVLATVALELPVILTAVLLPLALFVQGSVRFGRHRLQDTLSDRFASIFVKALTLFVALLPAAIISGSVSGLATVVALVVGASIAISAIECRLLGNGQPRRTLLVGSGPITNDIADQLSGDNQHGLELVGILESDRWPAHDHPVLGHPRDLLAIAKATATDVIIVTYGPFAPEDLVADLRRAAVGDVDVYVVPRFFELGRVSSRDRDEIHGYPLLKLSKAPTTRSTWQAKRLVDVVASATLLALAAPVMAVIALAVRRSSPGPIFYRQKRVGRDGSIFEILKFRTMKENDGGDVTWTVENDPLVTNVGKFLRNSHLDELPQLINVLRGEMSLIGPRPERPFFVDQFEQEHERYGDRHRVLPGVSGWSQVHGLWGDTSVEARVRLDNRYIEDWSFYKDIVIMLRTIPTLFKGRG